MTENTRRRGLSHLGRRDHRRRVNAKPMSKFLERRIREHGLNLDTKWYLDLRRYGRATCGFCLGVKADRGLVTGEHFRETIPFPRKINTIRP